MMGCTSTSLWYETWTLNFMRNHLWQKSEGMRCWLSFSESVVLFSFYIELLFDRANTSRWQKFTSSSSKTLNSQRSSAWLLAAYFFRFRHHMHKLKTTVESKMMGDYRREREIPFRLRLLILGWLLSHLHVWYHPSMNSYFIAIEWTQDFPLC